MRDLKIPVLLTAAPTPPAVAPQCTERDSQSPAPLPLLAEAALLRHSVHQAEPSPSEDGLSSMVVLLHGRTLGWW